MWLTVAFLIILALAIAAIVKIYKLGGYGDDESHILLPLYIFPDIEVYERVGRAMPLDVIINPDNGNGDLTEVWQVALRKMKAAAGSYWRPCYGYTYTGYAQRPLEEVKAVIDKYMTTGFKEFVSGIFVDETSSSNLAYYELLDQYVTEKYPGLKLILNPGTKPQNSGFFELKNVECIVVYEGPEPYILDSVLEGVPLNKSAVMINNPIGEDEGELLERLKNLGIAKYFVTTNNMYNTLPAYI